jgi:hypothetical protein
MKDGNGTTQGSLRKGTGTFLGKKGEMTGRMCCNAHPSIPAKYKRIQGRT